MFINFKNTKKSLVVLCLVSSFGTAYANRACTNNSFTSSIAGGFLSNNPYKVLDRQAKAFSSDCLNPGATGKCWGKPRHKVIAQWNNIKKWRAKVCVKNVESAANKHGVIWSGSGCNKASCNTYFPPKVSFQVRGSNNKWKHLRDSKGKITSWDIPKNKTHNYTWSVNGNTKKDFRIVVNYAKPYDEIDIMMDKVGGK